jgi:hypothetical protein
MNDFYGFKEWEVVCEALASGCQTVILRKGGIHEGRDGFAFLHENFFLFPTRFHATGDQVKESEVQVLPEWKVGDLVTISHYVKCEWARTFTDWQEVLGFSSQHIYDDKTVRDRFDWQGKGITSGSIHIAKVKVHKLINAWSFPYEAKYGGCRSWVKLETPPNELQNQISN